MDKKLGKSARVGIRDVAAAVGVSPTTVSHALSGARAINPATRARVLEVAKELGYSPDLRARGLRSSRTFTVGLLSDAIAVTPYAGLIISGAQDAAAEHQSVVLALDSTGDPQRELLGIRTLLDHRVDGLVYARMSHQSVNVPTELDEIPVVLANASSPDLKFSSVVPDEKQIGLDATGHLLSFGHERVGFATVNENVPSALGREEGYRSAMRAAGIAVNEAWVCAETGDAAGGRKAGRFILDREDRPTAIFCFNDEIAMGVYQAANDLGLRIPEDLSVIGVDDLQLITQALVPTLSTIALPHYQMGHWAVSQLFTQATALNGARIVEKLRCHLVQRESVKAPRS
ncbi:LacI family DNA-binding transcriptional regulator [Glutamicibacter mysorens]